MLNVEHKLMQQVAPNQTYEALPHPHKLGTVHTLHHLISFFILYFLFEVLKFQVLFSTSLLFHCFLNILRLLEESLYVSLFPFSHTCLSCRPFRVLPCLSFTPFCSSFMSTLFFYFSFSLFLFLSIYSYYRGVRARPCQHGRGRLGEDLMA